MGNLERDVLFAQQPLCPHEPLRDRCLREEEGASDLGDAEAADCLQAEGDTRVLRQRRMAAHEHHPQLVVFDRRSLGRVAGDRSFELPLNLRRPSAERRVPAQDVEGAIAGDAEQPAARVLRHAGVRATAAAP